MKENIDHLNISLPDQKNYDVSYGLAFRLACEKLAGLNDLEQQSRNSGSACHVLGNRTIIDLKYLNRQYRITLPDAAVSLLDGYGSVELRDKILILHYFTGAKGTPLSGHLIAYNELQEGAAYYPSFFKRAVKPLIDYFGQTPETLVPLAEKLGGYRATCGDVSVIIPAFIRVPITLVLWKGDDEFPPDANILFDSTILDYLSVEDINILCQTIVWNLVKLLKSG